jgi:hypothetical protein
MPADVDGRALSEWCREHLGALVAERVFTAGHLSAVYGLRLVDGREFHLDGFDVLGRAETESRMRLAGI